SDVTKRAHHIAPYFYLHVICFFNFPSAICINYSRYPADPDPCCLNLKTHSISFRVIALPKLHLPPFHRCGAERTTTTRQQPLVLSGAFLLLHLARLTPLIPVRSGNWRHLAHVGFFGNQPRSGIFP